MALGCLMSLYMMADLDPSIPTVEHDVTLESNPYTCLSVSPYTLASTLSTTPGRVYMFYYDQSGIVHDLYTGSGSDPKTYDVSPYVGKTQYVVVAYTSSQVMPGTIVTPAQYDIYNITVKYHIQPQTINVAADMFTKKADVQLFTSAGQPDPSNPGKTFCGVDFKYKVNEGTSENVEGAIIISFDPSLVNDVVTLPVGGPYVYSVYMVDRYGEITWCDRFYITVVTPNCASGLVYSKWDDFLFVDNGEGGGKGRFVSYQWYNSGIKIEGADLQWMRTTLHEGASPSGKYYVRIKDVDGNEIITCPKYFNEFPVSTVHNPHGSIGAPAYKQIRNGQLIIEHNGNWYNAQGVKVK